MLYHDLRVGGFGLAGDVLEHRVVEDDAVLEDLDEGRALIGARALQYADEMRLEGVDGPRHEPRARAEREDARRDGVLEGSERRRWRACPAA